MPEIKHYPKLHVAYVEETGPYDEAIQRGFARLLAWLGSNHVEPQGASLVIIYDDPAKVPPENLHSEECAPVAAEVQGSGEVRTKDIGDQQVATILDQGSQNRDQTFNDLYDWLHAEGYRDVGVPIETFLSQPGEDFRSEIAVPVEPVQVKASPQGRGANQRTAKKDTAQKGAAQKSTAKKVTPKRAARK